MPTKFVQCESDVSAVVNRIIRDHHPELKKAAIKVDLLFAYNEDGDAVSLHGYPCTAVVRKISYKNRVMGRGDAEITIDGEWWSDAPPQQRDALIDHELTHLEIVYDKNGRVKLDKASRPKLAMRLHDWEMGGFEEICKRHGKHALEGISMRNFKDRFGQFVFDFHKPAA